MSNSFAASFQFAGSLASLRLQCAWERIAGGLGAIRHEAQTGTTRVIVFDR